MNRLSEVGLILLFASAPFACAAGEDVRLLYGGFVELDPAVTFGTFARTEDWRLRAEAVGSREASDGNAEFDLLASGRVFASGRTEMKTAGAAVKARVAVGFTAEMPAMSVGLHVRLKAETFRRRAFAFGDEYHEMPDEPGSEKVVVARSDRLELPLPDGSSIRLKFATPVDLEWKDNRNWGADTFVLSCGDLSFVPRPKGSRTEISFTLSRADGVGLECLTAGHFRPEPGPAWIPFDGMKDIVAGSALDFSRMGFSSGPAGRLGWLRVRNGCFEFERLPGVRQWFYGVNICSDANFPSASVADEVTTRLVRLGYNAIRFHHHDGDWHRGTVAPFDLFMARAMAKGLYVTTDLYVSRHVRWSDIGIDRPGEVPMDVYKALCLFYEPAWRDFVDHARTFMEHVNPHTGRRYADEPGMPFVSVINEGAIDGVWDLLRKDPLFAAELERWCAEHPGSGWQAFMAEKERLFMRRFRRFWTEELKAKALLSNQNRGPVSAELRAVKDDLYDYVDRHFYRGHPEFPRTKWRLPSRVDNANPFRSGGSLLKDLIENRQDSRPYAVSEWNFGAPCAHRAPFSLLFGAVAANEGWDALWRFAYAHRAKALCSAADTQMGYFDLAADPINQMADRISLLLFRSARMGGKSARIEPIGMKHDSKRGVFIVESPQVCGIFAEKGIAEAGPLAARLRSSPAMVATCALDGASISKSRRLLVLHLTDAQPVGATYGDDTRTLLLDWGRGGCVAAAGSADVSIAVAAPESFVVYALAADGRRLGRMPSCIRKGRLVFRADVARDPASATLCYELQSSR